MITAVSLNPSIDRTLQVEKLKTGGLNRVKHQIDAAAGKGVNVALAAAALGEKAECIGFMYKEGAALFEKRLSDASVGMDFLMSEGAVRVNTKVLDLSQGEITELNTGGIPVSGEQIDRMTGLVAKHAAKTDFIVLSGSVPPGCPNDYYRELTESAGKAGAKVILDADGERLRTGLEAKPFMIKPNRYELEMLTGHILSSVHEVADAALACINKGVSVVVVSLGADGAIITDGNETWRARARKVEIRSTVAAGDTMIAGLAAVFSKEYDLQNALRLGVASATVRCMTNPDEMISGDMCREFAREIALEKLM